MDAFDEQFNSLIGGCLAALVVGIAIVGIVVLVASHIQWR